METSDEHPTPPARKGFPCLIVGLIVFAGLAVAAYFLFPVLLYIYAYLIMGTTG